MNSLDHIAKLAEFYSRAAFGVLAPATDVAAIQKQFEDEVKPWVTNWFNAKVGSGGFTVSMPQARQVSVVLQKLLTVEDPNQVTNLSAEFNSAISQQFEGWSGSFTKQGIQ